MFWIVNRAVMIGTAATACYALAEQFGSLTAALIWAAVIACACGLGVILLRASAIGRVTWRNRAAGYLVPWGWRLNGGRLFPVAVVSWAVWVAIGAAVFLLRQGVSDENPGVWFRIALFVAWVIDAAALMSVFGTIRQATTGARVLRSRRLTGHYPCTPSICCSPHGSRRPRMRPISVRHGPTLSARYGVCSRPMSESAGGGALAHRPPGRRTASTSDCLPLTCRR